KLALSLGLRRQLFLAVCDDLHLRNQVAARLHSTLAYPVGQVLYKTLDGQEDSTPAYPRLVTLRLNLNEPNPIAQINQWLSNYPPPIVGASKDTPGRPLPIPAFQIVGVEQLTKQSVAVQRLFLHYLRLSEEYLCTQEADKFQESSLLLWVSRPWLSAIQQSAPQFWRCRTGVFAFAGEPTPTIHNSGDPEQVSNSRSLDLGKVKKSTIEEAIIQAEMKAAAGELEYQENFTFETDTPVHRGRKSEEIATSKLKLLNIEVQQQETLAQSNVNNSPSLPYLSNVSQELTELVFGTNDTKSAENGEDNSLAQQILIEIEQLHSQQAEGEILAVAYHRLGNFYRLRIEQGYSSI
ncbi:MAG: tetratricopeptide repeat protein, partial [Bacteroidetes bacterium]|nr:tetratricopeptide repeat protein [Bacteroidota bacterium]